MNKKRQAFLQGFHAGSIAFIVLICVGCSWTQANIFLLVASDFNKFLFYFKIFNLVFEKNNACSSRQRSCWHTIAFVILVQSCLCSPSRLQSARTKTGREQIELIEQKKSEDNIKKRNISIFFTYFGFQKKAHKIRRKKKQSSTLLMPNRLAKRTKESLAKPAILVQLLVYLQIVFPTCYIWLELAFFCSWLNLECKNKRNSMRARLFEFVLILGT